MGSGPLSTMPTERLSKARARSAQTDHGTMSGALHHIAACRQRASMPIVGVEAYFRPDAGQQGHPQGVASVPVRQESEGLAQPDAAGVDQQPRDRGWRRLLPVPCRGLRAAARLQGGNRLLLGLHLLLARQLIEWGDSVAGRQLHRHDAQHLSATTSGSRSCPMTSMTSARSTRRSSASPGAQHPADRHQRRALPLQGLG